MDPSSDEARLLLVYLCGEREADPTAPARRATLWNVLNIAAQTGISSADAMRRELYVQDNIGQAGKGAFADNLQGWRAYFVNEHCHIALEVLLNALTHRINVAAGSYPDAVAREFARSVLLHGQNPVVGLDGFADAQRIDSLEFEHDLAKRLAEVAGSIAAPSPQDLNDAIRILLSLWRRWGADKDLNRLLADATAAAGGPRPWLLAAPAYTPRRPS